MRAVILAGGKGSRLKPYTNLIPKPLVPIGNDKSILEIIINQLASQGFKHITIAVNHFSKLIQSYFNISNIQRCNHLDCNGFLHEKRYSVRKDSGIFFSINFNTKSILLNSWIT